MAYLEGANAYFNKWPVHALAFENMRKLSPEKYRQVVGEEATDTPLEMNMEEALDATPHELSLKDDEVIAFPKEIAYEFAREVINVFAIDTFVALHGASGESMKADESRALVQHPWHLHRSQSPSQGFHLGELGRVR